MEKLFGEITDQEWIRYHWVDVTTTRDVERRFLQVRERTPTEAAAAAREIKDIRHPGWDAPPAPGLWRRVRDALKF